MVVETTIRPAKDRITGFEGRESHRTLFASGVIKPQKRKMLASSVDMASRPLECGGAGSFANGIEQIDCSLLEIGRQV